MQIRISDYELGPSYHFQPVVPKSVNVDHMVFLCICFSNCEKEQIRIEILL